MLKDGTPHLGEDFDKLDLLDKLTEKKYVNREKYPKNYIMKLFWC